MANLQQTPDTSLNQQDWRKILLRTGAIVVVITLIATVAAYFINLKFRGNVLFFDVALAFALSPIIGTPVVLTIIIKNQQLYRICKKMEILASTDALTGTLNRRAFTEQSNAYLSERRDQYFQKPVSFLAVDIDKFKAVNDQFGHQIGDKALILIAKTIAQNTRETDYFGRLGGEEFGILLPDTDAAVALVIAEGMRKAVSELHFSPNGQIRPLSISIGASSTTQDTNFSELYKRADDKLFEAKSSGRNNVKSCGGSIAPLLARTSNVLH